MSQESRVEKIWACNLKWVQKGLESGYIQCRPMLDTIYHTCSLCKYRSIDWGSYRRYASGHFLGVVDIGRCLLALNETYGVSTNGTAKFACCKTDDFDMSVGVYFSNWSIYGRKHFPNDIDYSCVDTVFYAFLSIDQATGCVKFSDSWGDLEVPLPDPRDATKQVLGLVGQFQALMEMHPRLRVVFSVGGWGTDHLFEAIANDSTKKQAFVNSCIEMVHKYRFHGVDIDWEYPKTPIQGRQLLDILTQLKNGLGRVCKLPVVSAALSGVKYNIDNLDVPTLNRVLDYFNLMCYDFTGSGWSSKTGYHSNLFGNNGDIDLNADQIVKEYIARGASPHKIMLGMPIYGRKFGGVARPAIGEPFNKLAFSDEGTVEYSQLPIGKEYFDSRKVGAFCYENGTFVSYDNEQSVRIKAAYVASHKLGGGFFWDSAGDKGGLVKQFASTLRERAD